MREPESVSFPQRLHLRVIGWGRSILLAGFPILLLYLLELLHLQPGTPTLDYLKIGAYIWAIITVFVTFDPQLNSKLTVLKDYASIFPFVGKDKKE
jgi:hypothetical protein